MVLEQIPVVWENEKKEEKKDLSQKEKVVDSAEHSSEENVAELNNNPQLAKEEADKIVEWLPDTLDQLSPEQQKQFVGLVEHDISWTNLNLAPKNVENVPDLIPPYWKQQVDAYKEIRRPENFSQLPIDKQEAFKKAEKEAISKMTEDSRGALESGWVTMPWESEPDSAPNTEPSNPTQWDEWNSGSQWWGMEF